MKILKKSKIMLNETDSKIIFFAMKRLFYCCIRSGEDKIKREKEAEEENKEYFFDDIDLESEKKINTDTLNMIHHKMDEKFQKKILDKKFRYDDILAKKGITEELSEELVKVRKLI